MIEPVVFFVEGKDDKRFFERIISLFFKSRLRKTEVRVMMHAQLSSEKLKRHIKALNESGVEYFFSL
jgi:hypothetical protein